MRLFLSEYLTGGAFPGDQSAKETLAVEGAAMLRALAADAAAIPGWQVAVTWDATLEPFGVPAVEVHLASSPEEERRLFGQLAATADVTLVIAPEFDGLLEDRSWRVARYDCRFAGASAEAIALCGDKLRLAEHFSRQGIPSIETGLCEFDLLEEILRGGSPDGIVVKPRYGAGSVDTFRVRSKDDVETARAAFAASGAISEPIVQPYVRGRSLSVAAIVSNGAIELFPVCEQHLSGSNSLHYAGGSVPAAEVPVEKIATVVRRAIESVPGLAGYIGLDLILPEQGPGTPLIVEINPRLTSSYHGYRRLAKQNLAGRIIDPEGDWPAVEWNAGRVDFLADGTATRCKS